MEFLLAVLLIGPSRIMVVLSCSLLLQLDNRKEFWTVLGESLMSTTFSLNFVNWHNLTR